MTLSPDIQQQRYAAIELAYSERRWLDVEQLSKTLLRELPDDQRDPLALRVVLLLGHTRLYGFGDSSLARKHYSTVLQHSDEQTLREIADQGLRQCTLLAEPETSDPSRNRTEAVIPTAEPTDPAGTSAAPASTRAAAAPWLAEQGIGDTLSRGAAGSTGLGADASPWLPSNDSDSVPTPLLRHDADLEADDPAEAADGPPTTRATLLATDVIEEPDQVEVALAADHPQPLDLIAVTSLDRQREGQQGEEELVEARLLAEPRPLDAAATPGSPPVQPPDELDELRRGLLRLKLD